MGCLSPQECAGLTLKRLIQEYYPSQEEFAFDFGTDIRTVSRYVNQGINKINIIQDLADHFHVSFEEFFKQPIG